MDRKTARHKKQNIIGKDFRKECRGKPPALFFCAQKSGRQNRKSPENRINTGLMRCRMSGISTWLEWFPGMKDMDFRVERRGTKWGFSVGWGAKRCYFWLQMHVVFRCSTTYTFLKINHLFCDFAPKTTEKVLYDFSGRTKTGVFQKINQEIEGDFW